MTEPTIIEVAAEANDLYTALASDVSVNLDLPQLTLSTDFELPPEEGNPAYVPLAPLTVDELTTKTVDGTGVFDAVMASMNVQMATQYDKGRITGGDYAKVYLGAIESAMQFGVQFLLSRDTTQLQNLQLQEQIKLTQIQRVRAEAELQVARGQIQQLQYATVEMQLKAYAARNDYATSKMNLVSSYNQTLATEAQVKLVGEQVDTQRAQTKETLLDGTAVQGIIGQDKAIKEAQKQTALEELDVARAQTKDTLLNGDSIGGIVAVDKAYKEAQQIQMENQGELTLEQVESQRGQTRDTLTTGESITGILAAEKATKAAQAKLVLEQYESQRGQTRGTLSTGEAVVGVLGAQASLYDQQVISYKRDAESKFAKLVLDTWTARKTMDDGVEVPVNIDTPAIDTMVQTYRGNLTL